MELVLNIILENGDVVCIKYTGDPKKEYTDMLSDYIEELEGAIKTEGIFWCANWSFLETWYKNNLIEYLNCKKIIGYSYA